MTLYKVACVCPSMYVGQYCETPVYTRCLGTLNTQCHRDYVSFIEIHLYLRIHFATCVFFIN